jgi:purine nucleosidase
MKYHVAYISLLLCSCSTNQQQANEPVQEDKNSGKIHVIIDTDANNELDDQHALAYAFCNQETFAIEGITVNNTRVGNGIQGHYDEAMRILTLFNEQERIPLYRGAGGSYAEILPHINEAKFDGSDAVDFIIRKARAADEKLVLLPIGKLTNIALALKRAPDIREKVRVVWLGSNYPDPGEYNLENDTTSVNPVIASGVELEMVVVRYGKGTGTHAVAVTLDTIRSKMPGLGAKASKKITGRHGGEFSTFGDYSVDLFSHIDLHDDPPSRALYDMVAVAILKNPSWGKKVKLSTARLSGYEWDPDTTEVTNVWIWETFNKDAILEDFFSSLEKATPK